MATRQLNKKAVVNIMNKRVLITEAHVGKKLLFTIEGDGTIIDVKTKDGELVQSVVEEGTVAQKFIFNLQANSGIAMKNEQTRSLSAEGLAAEKAGNATLAHEKFGDFLNKTRMSFNVFTTSSIVGKLHDRVDISARVTKITTPNGSLLTIDPSTISIVAPEAANTTVFSFDDEEVKDDAPEGNGETAEGILGGNKPEEAPATEGVKAETPVLTA